MFGTAVVDEDKAVTNIENVSVLMICNDKAFAQGTSFDNRFKNIGLYGRYMGEWLVQ